MKTLEQRIADVWAKLEQVMDPELDQSVRELGFISDVTVIDGEVSIALRLPTYWCSPNFSYMMMEDMRQAVRSLPWVESIRLRLLDHESADALNEGIDQEKTFQQIFPDATGDLGTLQRQFKEKAFYGRQKRLLDRLSLQGVELARWIPGKWQDVRVLVHGSWEDRVALERYADIVSYWGLPQSDSDPVVIRHDGTSVTESGWTRHWHQLRLVSLNMEANTHICRGLLQVRYAPDEVGSIRLPQ
jgi:metal-sulfur cluster biosynthetic enzyme